MAPILVIRPDGLYSILDGDDVLENLSKEKVENWFIEEFKKRFWHMARPLNLSEEDYAMLSGRIRCCDCGERVSKYRTHWKAENQRCERCIGGAR